ncbi:S66 family peptidase [Velocimicrobium porci]|uniref:S66 family peptidase n=1 Tax=Velocimicrobium porci TaxID=2606634 RepID=UPI0012B4201F|nr:S66 peptidase family protein [Velocimicrobium porci]
MIFPDFLKPGDVIGVTAPSDGNKKELDYIRLEHGILALKKKGYTVKETEDVRTSEKGRSSRKELRAIQLMDLYRDKRIKAIVSAKGGDFLCEILPMVDFDLIKKNPKWFQGYSDNTAFLFPVTTMLDIATIYGNNFNDFGMEPWHKAVEQNFMILNGKLLKQESFDYYEDGFHDKVTGLESYQNDLPVCWTNVYDKEEIVIQGRLLGGCLDVLLNLVGTRYDYVRSFIDRYKQDGILWFLESFDLGSEALIRGLWQLKEAGWFENVNGFVFGRPCMFSSYTDTTYEEAVLSILGDMQKPIIFNADIGHKNPQFTVINGAYGIIESKNGKGSLRMELR